MPFHRSRARRVHDRFSFAVALRALALPCAIAAFGGCGGDDPPSLRVRVITPPVDERSDAGLQARSLDEGAKRATWPLALVPGERDVYALPADAPEGYYTVETVDGGAMIGWHERTPPKLARDAAVPVTVMVGRPATLYVVAGVPEPMLGEEWAAVHADDGTAVEAAVTRDDSGMVALRFDPTRWRGGRFQVQGRFEDGSASEVLTILPASERPSPIFASAKPAPVHSLTVHLPGAAAGSARVRLRVLRSPLAIEQTREVDERGEARFDHVPDLGDERSLEVEAGGWTQTVSVDRWRRTGELRWAWPGTTSRTIVVAAPDGRPIDEVQARAVDAASYGVCSSTASSDAPHAVLVPPGAVRMIVRSGERWAVVEVPAERTRVDLTEEDFLPAAHLRVQARAAAGRLLLRRHEGATRALAQGFALVPREHVVDAALPPGTYDMGFEHASETREITLQAGRRVYVELDAERR
jgi:hypothetical protein